MKSIKQDAPNKPRPRKYPYLGQYKDGFIVLFSAKQTGTVVSCSDKMQLGHTLSIWAEDEFTLYEGEVILSND